MIFTLAWKNIWRNKKRSLIILAAIAVGLWSGLFAASLMLGSSESTVNSAINRNLSHIQIHTEEFVKEKLIKNYIPDGLTVVESVRRMNEVAAVSGRFIIEGMASSPTSSYGVNIIAINPQSEARVTTIEDYIIDGKYFDGVSKNPAIIGKKLAEKLGLRLHSKIVLSFQDFDGSIVYAAFKIAGIFKSESSLFDEMNLFVNSNDIARILNSNPVVNEIAVRLKSSELLDTALVKIKTLFPSLKVESWKELAPELRLTTELVEVEMYIFLAVILFALLFGITNTMLMSVLDRVREFGVLIAIGMKRGYVFLLIITETILLSLTGGALGMILGELTILYFANKGINLSLFAEGLSRWGMSPYLYPVLPFNHYLVLTGMIVVTAILAAVYPAIKTIRLQPAKAIRTF